MPSSSSEGSRKRPRPSSEAEDEVGPNKTKRAASIKSADGASPALDGLDDDDNNGGIDEYMETQEAEPEPALAPKQAALQVDPPPVQPPMPRVQTVSTREKYDAISRLKYTSQKEGDTWYVVSATWLSQWRRLCSPTQYKGDDSSLEPVDNSDIVDEQGALLPALQESLKYEIVCKEAWDHFVEWYGPPAHPLPRKVISEGLYGLKRTEVYPLKLFIFRMSKMTPASSGGTTPVIEISKTAKVQDLLEQVVQLSTLDPADLRYWLVEGTKLEDKPLTGTFYPSERIQEDGAQPFPQEESDKTKRIDEALIESQDAIVYEYRAAGTWTVDLASINLPKVTRTAPVSGTTAPVFNSEAFRSKYYSGTNNAIKPNTSTGFTPSIQSTAVTSFQSSATSPYSSNGRITAYTTPARSPGAVGLNNLGNTCFMNSALQCLAHSPELSEYFLTGFYTKELNPTNPLGMKGAIAEVFGSLLEKLWNPTSYAVAPREFKQQLQRFAPQFSGYAQHDTQEFLAFLLDGLHEDLNRVLKKPYVEMPDWDGGDDKALVQHATTAWEGYKKRNDSVIVDLFQGQYKSTLVCPECEKVSITFDPFMYLTLPLPVQRFWEHTIHWVPYDITKPHVKIPVNLPRDGSIKDLKLLMKKWMGAPVENQICIEVFSHKIYKDLVDHSPLGEIAERDIIVLYELPCPAPSARAKEEDANPHVVVPVYHGASGVKMYSQDLFGIPIYLAIPLEDTTSEEAIYATLVERYVPWALNPEQLYKRTVNITEPASSSDSPEDTPEKEELEEEDVTDMKIEQDEDHEMLPKSREASEVIEETNHGPQDNLFTIKAYAPVRNTYSYSGIMTDPVRNGTGETLQERATSTTKKKTTFNFKWSPSPTPEPPELINGKKQLITSEDTLLCEWDMNMLDFFFGITPSKGYKKEENSHWEQWDTFEHPDYLAAAKAKKATKERGITLEDCLDEFTKEERLGEDDLWYCPRCKKHQQATKKFELWKVPDILVVHLKRFSNSRFLRDKIDSFVDFPVESLDLGGRVEERRVAKEWIEKGNDLESLGISDASTKEPLMYDLYAVDEHLGGLGGGHYRAYAKNFQDDNWYHFDDTHVSNSSAKASVNSNAYLLFYRRRTEKPLGGELHDKVVEYKTKLESGEITNTKVESAAEPNGVASSAKSLGQEYSSSLIHAVSPDHSPPEHNEYFNGVGPSSHALPGLELGSNPFDDNDPPDFDSSFNDHFIGPEIDPQYMLPLVYRNRAAANSASSSNEAVSPTSSFGAGHQGVNIDKWNQGDDDDDPMEDMPNLEDADSYEDLRRHNNLNDIDSDHLDDESGPSVAPAGPSKPITPPLTTPSPSLHTPAQEVESSTPAEHEEPKDA